jgi:hypothetical protein
MLLALLALVLIAVCFAAKELVGIRRQLSSIRQFLEWSAVGFLENANPSPARREYLEKVKEDLIREGELSKQQVDDLRS